jgi:hypothetical protein
MVTTRLNILYKPGIEKTIEVFQGRVQNHSETFAPSCEGGRVLLS